MKKETQKLTNEFEIYLNNLLKGIDIQMQPSQKSIRDFVMEDGYKVVQTELLSQIQEVKNKVQKYLTANSLNLEVKKTDFYLKEISSSKGTKLSKRISQKLNLLGIYATEEEKKLADFSTNYILDILMKRKYLHDNQMLTNGEYYFEQFFSLNDLIYEKNSETKKITTLEGLEVVVAKGEGEDAIKVPLPYIFTRIVTLNEKDAFCNEKQINELLRSLFIGIKQAKSIQEQLKEQSVEIKVREQDGKLIFYGTKVEPKEVKGIITIDPKLTGIITTYMKNEIRTLARKNKIGAEVENVEDAKLEYLCRCGEFFSKLHQNGYQPIFIQSQADEAENKNAQLAIEDKGKLGINLPFGINGDIEDINKEFVKCFNSNNELFINKKEFDVIMGYILINNKFEKNEYLAYRKDALKLHEALETAQESLTQSIIGGNPTDIRDKIGEAYKNLNKTISRAIASHRNKKQLKIDKRIEREWHKRYTVSSKKETSTEALKLPQFDYKTLEQYFDKNEQAEMMAQIINDKTGEIIGNTIVREI